MDRPEKEKRNEALIVVDEKPVSANTVGLF